MEFSVIDNRTGEYPDLWEIALKEEWAKHLMYCDMEGFAIEEDGALMLMDECGKFAYCPDGRFTISSDIQQENEKLRIALAWMWFAYKNKDDEFPHEYEQQALVMAEKLLGKWEKIMPEMMKDSMVEKVMQD